MADSPVSQPFVAPGTRLSGDRKTALAILPEARKLLSVVKLFCQTAGVPIFKASRQLPGGSWIEALIAGGQEYVTVFGGGLPQRVRATIRKWLPSWVNAQFPSRPGTDGYWGQLSADGNTVCIQRSIKDTRLPVEAWSRESGAWVDTQLPALDVADRAFDLQLSANGKELTLLGHVTVVSSFFHYTKAVWSRESGAWIDTHFPNYLLAPFYHLSQYGVLPVHSGDGKTHAHLHVEEHWEGFYWVPFINVQSRESGGWVDTKFPPNIAEKYINGGSWEGKNSPYGVAIPTFTLSTDGKVMIVCWADEIPSRHPFWGAEVWSRESGGWVNTGFPPIGMNADQFILSADGKTVAAVQRGTTSSTTSNEVWSRESGKWVDTCLPLSASLDSNPFYLSPVLSGDGKTLAISRKVTGRPKYRTLEVWTRESGAWGNTNFPLPAGDRNNYMALSPDGKVVMVETTLSVYLPTWIEVWSRESGVWVNTQFPEVGPASRRVINSWSSDHKSVLRLRHEDDKRYPEDVEVWTLREVETETDG
jgi:hypothetical protein